MFRECSSNPLHTKYQIIHTKSWKIFNGCELSVSHIQFLLATSRFPLALMVGRCSSACIIQISKNINTFMDGKNSTSAHQEFNLRKELRCALTYTSSYLLRSSFFMTWVELGERIVSGILSSWMPYFELLLNKRRWGKTDARYFWG